MKLRVARVREPAKLSAHRIGILKTGIQRRCLLKLYGILYLFTAHIYEFTSVKRSSEKCREYRNDWVKFIRSLLWIFFRLLWEKKAEDAGEGKAILAYLFLSCKLCET